MDHRQLRWANMSSESLRPKWIRPIAHSIWHPWDLIESASKLLQNLEIPEINVLFKGLFNPSWTGRGWRRLWFWCWWRCKVSQKVVREDVYSDVGTEAKREGWPPAIMPRPLQTGPPPPPSPSALGVNLLPHVIVQAAPKSGCLG